MLTAIEIIESDAASAPARAMMDALSARLAALTGDDGRSHFTPEGGLFLLALEHGQPVGCGALRPLGDGIGEIKRMYAQAPGRGIGSAMLAQLERHARAAGYQALWLSTRRVNQAAIDFYCAKGYRARASYGPYVGVDRSVCFEKPIAPVGPDQHARADGNHR